MIARFISFGRYRKISFDTLISRHHDIFTFHITALQSFSPIGRCFITLIFRLLASFRPGFPFSTSIALHHRHAADFRYFAFSTIYASRSLLGADLPPIRLHMWFLKFIFPSFSLDATAICFLFEDLAAWAPFATISAGLPSAEGLACR